MSATTKTTATSCPVTDGMYVRAYITTLRLDAIAAAYGQCQLVFPDDWGVCIPGPLQSSRTFFLSQRILSFKKRA